MRPVIFFIALLLLVMPSAGQDLDLLIKNGRVIDPKNGISEVMDVGIADGRIAEVAADIDGGRAETTIDTSGLYVTPGIIDLHVHVFHGTEEDAYISNSFTSVPPDAFTFRAGVTTAVVVGVKLAHYMGRDWTPTDRAVEAGRMAGVPVMIDFGGAEPALPIRELFFDHLRAGDVFTHTYANLATRESVVDEEGRFRPFVLDAQERGIVFDVGHGGGSFFYSAAQPATRAGFWPNTISTDLHTGSMNGGMKDMANVMSKFLSLGMSLEDVIRASTWTPAQVIQRAELGNLDAGVEADVAVFRLREGNFGFTDVEGYAVPGDRKLEAELTLRAGRIVWDLNGMSAETWTQ